MWTKRDKLISQKVEIILNKCLILLDEALVTHVDSQLFLKEEILFGVVEGTDVNNAFD